MFACVCACVRVHKHTSPTVMYEGLGHREACAWVHACVCVFINIHHPSCCMRVWALEKRVCVCACVRVHKHTSPTVMYEGLGHREACAWVHACVCVFINIHHPSCCMRVWALEKRVRACVRACS